MGVVPAILLAVAASMAAHAASDVACEAGEGCSLGGGSSPGAADEVQATDVGAKLAAMYGTRGAPSIFERSAPPPLASMAQILSMRSAYPGASRAVASPTLFGYLAVVSAYRRPHMVERLVLALARQTHAPQEVWVCAFASPVQDELRAAFDRARARLGPDLPFPLRWIAGEPQLKYHARFQLALQSREPFTLLLDDDCEIQPRFVEAALHTFHVEDGPSSRFEAVLGIKGHISEGVDLDENVDPRAFWGPVAATDELREADVVGGGWLVRTDWLRVLWRERPLTFETAEDYALCAMARKYLGVRCLVLPFAQDAGLEDTRGVSPDYFSVSKAGDSTHGAAVRIRSGQAIQHVIHGCMPSFAHASGAHMPVLLLADTPVDAAWLGEAVHEYLLPLGVLGGTVAPLYTGRGLAAPARNGTMVHVKHMNDFGRRLFHPALGGWVWMLTTGGVYEQAVPGAGHYENQAYTDMAGILRATAPRAVLTRFAPGRRGRTGTGHILLGALRATAEAGVPAFVIYDEEGEVWEGAGGWRGRAAARAARTADMVHVSASPGDDLALAERFASRSKAAQDVSAPATGPGAASAAEVEAATRGELPFLLGFGMPTSTEHARSALAAQRRLLQSTTEGGDGLKSRMESAVRLYSSVVGADVRAIMQSLASYRERQEPNRALRNRLPEKLLAPL